MQRAGFLSWLLIVLLIFLAGCSSGETDTPKLTSTPTAPPAPVFSAENPAHVLRLDSYHAEYLWSQQINAGVERALSDQGFSVAAGNLVIDYFYMDTKRQNDGKYLASIAQSATNTIRDKKPDVIIATDNNAVRLVVSPMADENVTVVFAGLNDNPATYGLVNRSNVTGVLERLHISGTLDWIQRVFPEADRVVCIFDESETTEAYYLDVQAALAQSPYAGSPVYLINNFDDWQAKVLNAPAEGDVLIIGNYHTLRDANNEPVHEDAVITWMVENSPLPIVPFWEFSIPFGALGGDVISGENQGYAAGTQAALILKGTLPGDIPIETPAEGKLIVNQAAAEHWNVTIPADLLEVSEIYTP